jgi:hypothetical protein
MAEKEKQTGWYEVPPEGVGILSPGPRASYDTKGGLVDPATVRALNAAEDRSKPDPLDKFIERRKPLDVSTPDPRQMELLPKCGRSM